MFEVNLAAAHEAISAAVPDRECVVWRERRLSWAAVGERTRRLAGVLRAHGLGWHRDRSILSGWESGQDHVALYLHNGNEFLEGMLGAYKARVAPFNVNFRYVAEELTYVLNDASARAIVCAGRLAPTLAQVLPSVPSLELILQVDDGSGTPLLPGAIEYESALASASPYLSAGLSPDDLYVLYTGGTTGMPKGVLWRQGDFVAGALGIRPASLDELVETAVTRGARMRVLPAPPFMHGAAHWNAWSAWLGGGTVVVQSDVLRTDPHDLLATIERERCTSINMVGDAFARPFIDALAEHPYDMSTLRHVVSGGAILSASVKQHLIERIPGVTVVDIVGASEAGRQGVHQSSAEKGASTGSFHAEATATVLDEHLTRELRAGEDAVGWLAQRGHIPLGYLGDEAKTTRTFPIVDGVRYVVPGDRGRRRADGSLELLGRESVTINTGGEKVFAEEVEHILKLHDAVYDALVVGRSSERWGQEVVAVVHLRDDAVTDDALRAFCATHLARYKLPKSFVRRPAISRSVSGKPDYVWARAQVEAGS
jgi:fatty-acyl-CoA synthase